MGFSVPPKPDDERMRKNPPIYKTVPLRWDGLRRGKELPPGYNWSDRTLEWWDMWRDSVQAMVMLPSDWEAMFEAALLHDFIWKQGKKDFKGVTPALQELRRKVAQYGATHFDRLNLRMEIEAPWMVKEHKAEIEEAVAADASFYLEMLDKAAKKQKDT